MTGTPEPPQWTNEEIAEFLLNNSVNPDEYRRNLLEVMALGVDPLALNAEHLMREEAWSRAEEHLDLLASRKSS